MTCKDFMTKHPVTCVPSNTAGEAMRLMRGANVGALPVVADVSHRLVGIITDRDLMVRVDAAGRDPDHTRIAEVMTGHPIVCEAGTSYHDILEKMSQHACRRLPVVDEANVVIGIVTQDDLLPFVDWGDLKSASTVSKRNVWPAAAAGACAGMGLGAGLVLLLRGARGVQEFHRPDEAETGAPRSQL